MFCRERGGAQCIVKTTRWSDDHFYCHTKKGHWTTLENHSSSFDKVAHIHIVNALPITEKCCNAF